MRQVLYYVKEDYSALNITYAKHKTSITQVQINKSLMMCYKSLSKKMYKMKKRKKLKKY